MRTVETLQSDWLEAEVERLVEKWRRAWLLRWEPLRATLAHLRESSQDLPTTPGLAAAAPESLVVADDLAQGDIPEHETALSTLPPSAEDAIAHIDPLYKADWGRPESAAATPEKVAAITILSEGQTAEEYLEESPAPGMGQAPAEPLTAALSSPVEPAGEEPQTSPFPQEDTPGDDEAHLPPANARRKLLPFAHHLLRKSTRQAPT
ncbi:MAG: hypothetical protein EXR62_16280 [Chloroflexi bacterium]|nr:hypothetical protein [Chloroflexota bacterium]